MSTQTYGWRSIRLRLFLLFALVIAAVLFYAVRDVMTQWPASEAMARGTQYAALSVRIDASAEGQLEALKGAVARHLDRFAFREAPLRFDWQDQ